MIGPHLKMVLIDATIISIFPAKQKLSQCVVIRWTLRQTNQFGTAPFTLLTLVGPIFGAFTFATFQFFGGHHNNTCILLPNHIPEIGNCYRQASLRRNVRFEQIFFVFFPNANGTTATTTNATTGQHWKNTWRQRFATFVLLCSGCRNTVSNGFLLFALATAAQRKCGRFYGAHDTRFAEAQTILTRFLLLSGRARCAQTRCGSAAAQTFRRRIHVTLFSGGSVRGQSDIVGIYVFGTEHRRIDIFQFDACVIDCKTTIF